MRPMVIYDHVIGVLDEVGKVISEEEEMGIRAFSIIEEPRSKLRGMFCRAAVLRIDRKEFCLI